MKQSKFITQNKLSLALILFIVILSIILIPGINKYVHEYNAMSQELNRLGVKIDEISLEPAIKTVVVKKEQITKQQPTIETQTNNPQPISIDYKPLEDAVDAAIGIEDIGDNTPFAKPEPVIVKKITQKKIKAQPAPIKAKVLKKVHSTYVVQVASFNNKNSAYKFKNKLSKLHLNTIVSKQNNLYKVIILPKNKTKIAATSLKKSILKKYKINGYVNKMKI